MLARWLCPIFVAAPLLIPTLAPAQVALRNMQLLAQKNDFPLAPGARAYSACWSYIHSDGREYAVLGHRNGTAIYNVTDPAGTTLVGFIAGPQSQWREMKSYRDWIYVSTEGVGPSPPPGLQIIRMTDPEHPVLAGTYTGSFIRCHTVAVDTTRALLACNGARAANGQGVGMFLLSLANPEAPLEIANWPGGRYLGTTDSQYVHDSNFVGDRLYLSCIDWGMVRVMDVSNPSAPAQIAAWNYPGGYTHNTWLDDSGRFLYATDEVKGEPLKVFDISDLQAPRLVNTVTNNPQACVHNAFVHRGELYLANYSEGVRVLDLSDPAHPAEFAWADTWLPPEGPFTGVWNVCAEFPSGTVIASDFLGGLFVVRPIRNYGIARLAVVNASTGQPVEGAIVTVDTHGDSLTTPADGIAQFAPDPGPHAFFIRKFGYLSTAISRAVSLGSRDTVVVELEPIPSADLDGTLRRLDTHEVLDDAEVELEGSPVHVHAGADGGYRLSGVPDGDYTLAVHRPGFAPIVVERHIGPPDATQNYELNPAHWWDPLEGDSGWTVGAPGDVAAGALWTRVTPFPGEAGAVVPEHEGGTSPFYPRLLQPRSDRTPGAKTMCFLTGQGIDAENLNTLVGGSTTLTSPPLDLAGLEDPAVSYWRWFYSDGDDRDWFAVLLSGDGGATWTSVDTTRGRHDHWDEESIRVRDYFPSVSTARVRFVAHEGGAISAVEAAVDDIATWDAAISAVSVDPPDGSGRLAFGTPHPNPSAGGTRLALVVPTAARVEVDVLDLAGRRVRSLHRGWAAAGTLQLNWDGGDDAGRPVSAGVYFARARGTANTAQARIARLR